MSDPAENWQRLESLFNAALYMNPEQRHAYLRDVCGDDQALREQVLSLLDADAQISKDGGLNQVSIPPSAIHRFAGHAVRTGQNIGPYQILEEIGSGGMGVVYKALDTRLDRVVAIKCLSAHHLNEQARQRFLTEARAASRVEHPNICAIYDIGDAEDGTPYIVMPHYEGEDLRARMRGPALAASDALAISAKVCEGLDAAHGRGIFHRDIKPANILLTSSGEVKILDFGVAKVTGVENTSPGASVGTAAYMAPEQIRGEPVDGRADIWALGVVFYEAITGNHPFRGEHSHEVMYAVLNMTPVPVSSFFKTNSLNHLLDRLTGRMLARNPADRYPSARALREDITQAERELSQGRLPQLREDAVQTAEQQRQDTDWDELTLSGISDELTRSIGPIAPVLVKRYSKQVRSLAELCQKLAGHLPSEKERQAFIKRLTKKGAGFSGISAQHSCPQHLQTSATLTDPECLRKVEEVLVPMIGPVAKSIIRRAQVRHTGCQNICEEIAGLLVDEKDKQRFLDETKSLCLK